MSKRTTEPSQSDLSSDTVSAIKNMYAFLSQTNNHAEYMKGLQTPQTTAEAVLLKDTSLITTISANPAVLQARKWVEIEEYMELLQKAPAVAATEAASRRSTTSTTTIKRTRKPTGKPKPPVPKRMHATKMSSKPTVLETPFVMYKDEPTASNTLSTPIATSTPSPAPLSSRVNKILSDLRMLLSDYSILSGHFLDPKKKATLDANKASFSAAGEIDTDPYLIECYMKMTKLLKRVIRLEAAGLDDKVNIAKLKALEDNFIKMEANYKVDLVDMKALRRTLERDNGSAAAGYTKYPKGVGFQMIGSPEAPVAAAPEVKVKGEKRNKSLAADSKDKDDIEFQLSGPSRKKRKSSAAASKAAESSSPSTSQVADPSSNSTMPFKIYEDSPESAPFFTTSDPLNSTSKSADFVKAASKAADSVEPASKSADYVELSLADRMKKHHEMKVALADKTLTDEERTKLRVRYDENKARIKAMTKQIQEALESDGEMDDGNGKQGEASA